MWRSLNNLSRSSPGPVLEIQEARLLAEQWLCELYKGQKLLGATVYAAESSSGLKSQFRSLPSPPPHPPSPKPTSSPSIRDLTSSSLGLTYFCH